MRIGIVANSAWYQVNFRLSLARSLRSAGHDVCFISPKDGHEVKLADAGFPHHDWHLQAASLNPLSELASVLKLRQLLRQQGLGAVLSYTPKGNIYSGLAVRGLGIRFLPNVSGLGRSFIRRNWVTPIVTRLYGIAFAHAEGVIFQNEDDRKALVQLQVVDEPRTLRVPGSGVDLQRFHPAERTGQDHKRIRFLMVARVLWDKGIGEFVAAAREVRHEHPEAEFLVLGEGRAANPSAVPPEQLRAWIDEGVISHQDHVDDVLPYLRQADCVVLPSYREGVPRSLLEAAACGRPVIASDAPGCREPVRHGVNGFLCDVRSAKSLAASMRAFIALTPAEREAMGRAGRTLVEADFDERIVLDNYRRWLARPISPPARPARLGWLSTLCLTLATALTALNIAGWFADPEIANTDPRILDKSPRTMSAEVFWQRSQREPAESDAQFTWRMTQLVNDRILLMHPQYTGPLLQQNWALWLLAKAAGGYEWVAPARAAAVGAGYCSAHAMLLDHVLKRGGIRDRVWSLNGHVLNEAWIDGRWQVFDADYLVHLDRTMPSLFTDGQTVYRAYLDAGRPEVSARRTQYVFTRQAFKRPFDSAEAFAWKSVWAERVSWVLIWIVPAALAVLGWRFSRKARRVAAT
ncbi:glycosyltransferase family 4 protein [Roseateles sp.]|uniref:glycosyltransferase family 4 protein n=1 Tax=Roseateles sp. TaxID=1971397 RepID=UPI003BAA227A